MMFCSFTFPTLIKNKTVHTWTLTISFEFYLPTARHLAIDTRSCPHLVMWAQLVDRQGFHEALQIALLSTLARCGDILCSMDLQYRHQALRIRPTWAIEIHMCPSLGKYLRGLAGGTRMCHVACPGLFLTF